MLILIVEDEALIAFAIEWSLNLAGHRLLGPADTAADAITLSANIRPDLALIDLNLRGDGDGVDVAKYLTKRWETPVLFLSAQAAYVRANPNVAWGLVSKPCDIANLPRIVHFISEVTDGRQPDMVPHGLEFFRPMAG